MILSLYGQIFSMGFFTDNNDKWSPVETILPLYTVPQEFLTATPPTEVDRKILKVYDWDDISSRLQKKKSKGLHLILIDYNQTLAMSKHRVACSYVWQNDSSFDIFNDVNNRLAQNLGEGEICKKASKFVKKTSQSGFKNLIITLSNPASDDYRTAGYEDAGISKFLGIDKGSGPCLQSESCTLINGKSIYCNRNSDYAHFSKAYSLEYVLLTLNLYPKSITIIDDEDYNINAILHVCKKRNIEFKGFHFRQCEKIIPKLEKIMNVQEVMVYLDVIKASLKVINSYDSCLYMNYRTSNVHYYTQHSLIVWNQLINMHLKVANAQIRNAESDVIYDDESDNDDGCVGYLVNQFLKL
jgi:hypothetical protein